MFPAGNAKTTAAVRRVKHLIAATILIGGIASLLQARSYPPLAQDQVSNVLFSGVCLEKQWSVTPTNSLELILTSGPEQSCIAELSLREPLLLKTMVGLAFVARSSHPNGSLQIELQESENKEPVRSVRFRPQADWRPDGLLFDHVRSGWHPKHLSILRVVMPPTHQRGTGSVPEVFIRDIRLVGPSPLLPPRTDRSDAIPDQRTPGQRRPVGLYFPPPAASTPSRVHGNRRYLILAPTMLALLGIPLLRRRKSSASIPLSPLFEINTRTWKSRRDADGVLLVGGFRTMTVSDLRIIKENGFNAIWLMGIWEIGSKVRHISTRYGSDFAGSPFAINDYHVSEELGTEREFQNLVDRAHAQGLGVIVDFVPNHMGLDTTWLNDHPEYFLHKVMEPHEQWLPDVELERRYPGYFPYRTPAYPENGTRVPRTIMVAYGRDPYFYPWIETAQLDYAEPGLRRRMIDVLGAIAKRVDGVRCDMAMLVLREQVKIHRHPGMSWDDFNALMPEEFWPEAVRSTKRIKPDFVFIAETYWSMEGYLQHLGFDYTYNKPLYESICTAFHSGQAEGLMNFIRMLGNEFLAKGVHFLENHDEERAMNALGDSRQRGAAVLLATLPGILLIHQGQTQGKCERLPVQRAVPLQDEPINESLEHFYRELLRLTGYPVFRHGLMLPLYSNNPALISIGRLHESARAVVIINTSDQTQKGSVFLTPGMRLKAGAVYKMEDLYYPLKHPDTRREPAVQPHYVYPAAQLINQGLYVELQPFDAHILVFEGVPAHLAGQYAKSILRELNIEWPLPRAARRMLSPALLRFTDRDFKRRAGLPVDAASETIRR